MYNEEAYFDFEEKTELPEEVDFRDTKRCPHCQKPIPHDASMCLYCGEGVYSDYKKSKWFIVILVFVIICFFVWVLVR